ncbi:MAG: heme A synthase [Clostridia bacterium]|nr:heme A synthase [Clostridia bacterium]
MREKRLRRLAIWTSVVMFSVLVMGALVTNSGAREGCGHSWPLCHGRWIPAYAVETLIEFGHRLVSAAGGILTVALAVAAWRRHGHRREVRAAAVVAVLFVFVQALLGGAAVLWSQSAEVLALHFGISLIAFGGVVVLTTLVVQLQSGADQVRDRAVPHRFRKGAWAALAYTYVVVYLGAYVRHADASLACLDWPLCQGTLWPSLGGAVGIHFAHRLAAAGALAFLGWMYVESRRIRVQRPDLHRGALVSLLLLVLQVVSGGLVVLTRLSLASTILHAALVTLLFAAQSYLCLQVLPRPAAARAANPRPAARPAPGRV